MKLVFILLVFFAFQLNKSAPEPVPAPHHPNASEPIPSHQPSVHPTPSSEPIPSHQPSVHPTPSSEPIPSHQPSVHPTPSSEPLPSHQPSVQPTHSEPIPSHQPSVHPTPSSEPIPSHQPSVQPTPSSGPLPQPISVPLPSPSPEPFSPEEALVWHWVDLGLHIALIVAGLCWLIVGYRLIKVILFVAGYMVFFFIALQLLLTLAVAKGLLAQWLAYTIAAILGLIGGGVFSVTKLGVFLFGTMFGILFSSLVLSCTPLATLSLSSLIQLIILLCTGVILGIVAIIFERPIFIVGTSFNGSYLIFNSIDSEWVQSGASNMLIHIIKDFNTSLSFDVGNWKAYLILAAIFILTVVGVIVQFKWTAGEQKSKSDSEGEPLLTKFIN